MFNVHPWTGCRWSFMPLKLEKHQSGQIQERWMICDHHLCETVPCSDLVLLFSLSSTWWRLHFLWSQWNSYTTAFTSPYLNRLISQVFNSVVLHWDVLSFWAVAGVEIRIWGFWCVAFLDQVIIHENHLRLINNLNVILIPGLSGDIKKVKLACLLLTTGPAKQSELNKRKETSMEKAE